VPQPTNYEPGYDFEDFQADNPSSPLPANKLQQELESISAATGAIIDRAALIQRDDGAIRNQVVTPDALKRITGAANQGRLLAVAPGAAGGFVMSKATVPLDGFVPVSGFYPDITGTLIETVTPPTAADGELGDHAYSTSDVTMWFKTQSNAWTRIGDISTFDPTGDVLQGGGAPLNTLGVNGDAYVDTLTSERFGKLSGSWVLVGALNGTVQPRDEQIVADAVFGGKVPYIWTRPLRHWIEDEAGAVLLFEPQRYGAPGGFNTETWSGGQDDSVGWNLLLDDVRDHIYNDPQFNQPITPRIHILGRRGVNYRLDSTINMTDLQAEGVIFDLNGAQLCSYLIDNRPMVDATGSRQIKWNLLRTRAENGDVVGTRVQPSHALVLARKGSIDAAGHKLIMPHMTGWYRNATYMNNQSEICAIYGGVIRNSVDPDFEGGQKWKGLAIHLTTSNESGFDSEFSPIGEQSQFGMNSQLFDQVEINGAQARYGAVRIEGGAGGATSNVIFRDGYIAVGDGPGITFKGTHRQTDLDIHIETVGVTHNIMFETDDMPAVMHGFRHQEPFPFCSVALLGRTSAANPVTINDGEIRVGEPLFPSAVRIAEAGMDMRMTGRIGYSNPQASLHDMTGFGAFDGQIMTPASRSAFTNRGNVRALVHSAGDGYTSLLGQVIAPDGPPTAKNLCWNGEFNIAQRGGTINAVADDAYDYDGWINLSDGNGIVNVGPETAIAPPGSARALKVTVATANKKFGRFFPLEAKDCNGLLGQTVTASFMARKGGANATLGKLRCALISWTGTADAITSDVVDGTNWGAAGTNPTLAASWTFETVPADLVLTTDYQRFSCSGAIDTASTKQVGLLIWCDDTNATVADIVYLGQVQIEQGLAASAYNPLPYDAALAKAKRYYTRLGKSIWGKWRSSISADVFWAYRVQMRVSPTVTLLTTTPTLVEIFVSNRVGSSSTLTPDGDAQGGWGVIDGFSSATANNSVGGATSDIIEVSAEL
jgi:hypothetical protein